MTEIKGWHVFTAFTFAFSIIIGVNLALAYNAVRTFPGLEVKNSYVASQSFEEERSAQDALGWDVSASLVENSLQLEILEEGRAISPEILEATFGRATTVANDQSPTFSFDGTQLVADVDAGPGNWNLRLKARAEDGTIFRQRIIVRVSK